MKKKKKNFKLKFFDLCIIASKIYRIWRTHQVLNHSKCTKIEENMGLELNKGLKHIFQNFKANCPSSSSYVFCIAHLFFMFKQHM